MAVRIMKLLMAIHKALDFFFCDRCITEADLPGRTVPAYWFIELIDKVCPIQFLFKLLPEEPSEKRRRIYFPRSWLDRTKWYESGGIRE